MLASFSKKFTGWLKHNLPDLLFVAVIVGTGIFVGYKNFVPGTWLLGWDSLVPELNLKLNITRSFFALWQEYQGLGLLGGMAHAADLPRQIILWLFSFAFPISFLRYLWTFLMLILGPVGTYFLSKSLLRRGEILSAVCGFSAAIFYIFNLVTLQTFYTPFETFIGFYGFLPWLLLSAINYLKNGGRKRLLFYVLVSVLATSAFYVQTLFVVYAFFLLVFAVETLVRLGKDGIVRGIKIGLVTLFINAFWLAPVVFFGFTSADIPAKSHINSIATPETQLMNLARADFKNIATFKGYWLDYFDWKKDGSYDYLYKDWVGFLASPGTEKFSLILFLASVLGIALSLIKKKTYFGVSFLVLLGASYFMLDGGNIPWIPFFSDIFRNAFTKWANALVLVCSVGLGFFVFIISDIIRNKLKYLLAIILALLIAYAGIYTTKPVLNGKLIADSIRVNLPSYYQETINYFRTQDVTKRIADFPITDFWGWKFNDWGYGGSGFLWYGIPQPMLDRAFDVWSPNNEAFYKDVSHAAISEDSDELKYVLNKYQISYVLFDESIYEPGNPNSFIQLQKQKAFLESLDIVSLDKKFGKISIYKVNLGNINSFVSVPQIDYEAPYISFGPTGGLFIKEAFLSSQGYPQAKNCNLKGLGNVVKEKIDGGNYYEADNDGVSCDYFYYPTLDPSRAYLMKIKGENISGRSLKFYLYSLDRQAIVQEELLPVGNFDKSYYILPVAKSNKGALGYTLNVETRSFGKMKSENIINSIEFYAAEVSPGFKGQNIQERNGLRILSVKKYGTAFYQIQTEGRGLLELGQGYQDGWVAIGTNRKPLEHLKVDSWANGWEVSNQVPSNNYQVLIFFWPQILEWAGFVLLVLSLAVIIPCNIDF